LVAPPKVSGNAGHFNVEKQVKLHLTSVAFIAAAAVCATPHPVHAWGATGHATVANIAELNLKPAVWAEIKTLLAVDGVTHMAKVASWADQQREPGDPVHTTRVPIDSSPAPAHACTGTAMCADEAIAHYTTVLADRSKPAAAREEALKYIIHLVGDLHQPLHGSDPVGYNLVSLNGTATTIHPIWDNTIIDAHGVASATLAQELMANGQAVALGGAPRDWASESSAMARDYIYESMPACWDYKEPACPGTPVALPNDYAAAKYPLVAQRLKQGGYRLAALLNSLLQS
jgi:hypothetical protein